MKDDGTVIKNEAQAGGVVSLSDHHQRVSGHNHTIYTSIVSHKRHQRR